jgi:hypothetical protein
VHPPRRIAPHLLTQTGVVSWTGPYSAVVAASLIADEFVLLALYASYEGWPLRSDGVPEFPPYLDLGVSVALLAELAVMGAVVIDGGRVVATGRKVSGNADLGELAAQIADHPKRRSAAWWGLNVADAGPALRQLFALRRRGSILEYERVVRHLWWSRTVPSWFVREDDSTVALALDRLNAALDRGKADERTRALLAVVHGCGVDRAYFKNMSRREREHRIRRLIRQHWARRAIKDGLPVINMPTGI